MDLITLVQICQDYRDLGDAVQEQLSDMLTDCDPGELNGNAVRMIRDFLKAIKGYLDEDGQNEVDTLIDVYSDEALKNADALCAEYTEPAPYGL